MYAGVSEAKEVLDLAPDDDGERDARNEQQHQHDPEPETGTLRPLAMLDASLPSSPMETHGVTDGFVIHDRDVV